MRTQLNAAQHDLARIKVRIEQVEALSSQSSPAMARINQTFHELSRIEERLHALAQLAGERSRSLAGQIVTNFGEDPGILKQRAAELDAQAQDQQRTVSEYATGIRQGHGAGARTARNGWPRSGRR